MKRRQSLVWDRWNREHIKKHAITVSEIEEGYHAKNTIKARGKNGRLIMIIISFEGQENPYVVSARNAEAKERRIYYEKVQKT